MNLSDIYSHGPDISQMDGDRFVSVIHHEIRNPIARLEGYIQVLEETTDISDAQSQLLQGIKKATNDLKSVHQIVRLWLDARKSSLEEQE